VPHLKCVNCKTRYSTPGGATDPIEHLCLGCGSAFVPVDELSELVGFRAITAHDRSAARGAPGAQQAFVDRIANLLDRRAAAADARANAECWTDGDTATAEAVALPRPETTC
jgi:hypothetical protein